MFSFALECLYAEPFYDFDEPKTQEEALFIRRIIEFWNESEYELAQSQIEDFLQDFPENTYADTLHAILGDLAMLKQDYSKAAAAYSEVNDANIKKRVLINKLDCMKKLEWHLTLAEECEANLDAFSEVDPEKHQKIVYLLADALYNLTLRSPVDSSHLEVNAAHARDRFESLLETDYALGVMQPLAHIYCIMGDHSKASSLFIALADKKPSYREEMLFQAANMQVKYDKNLAIQTFGQIYHLGKKKAPEAAYNRMILLFETEKYGEILLAKDQLLQYIPKEKTPLVHFFIGRSHYHLDDYKRALSELHYFIDSKTPLKTELHDAFLTAIESSIKLQDLDQFNDILAKFQEEFPESNKLGQAYQQRAVLHKQLGKYKLAKNDFKYVLENFPDYNYKESLLYDFAHLLFQMEDWNESRNIAKIFIDDFASNPKASIGWRLFINASIESASQDETLKRTQLIPDLFLVLDQQNLLEEEEKDEYFYLLSKTYYDLDEYRDALDILIPLVKDNISTNMRANSYLMMANCYKKGLDNLDLFCTYAEKALQENPNLESKNQIHLALFNSYLKLFTQNSLNNPLQNASEHLYEAISNGVEVKSRNKLWLITFYHNTLSNYLDENFKHEVRKDPETLKIADRSLILLNQVVKSKMTLAEKEPYIIILADTHGFKKEFRKKLKILEKLNHLYEKHPDVEWNFKNDSKFELAKSYVECGKKKEGLVLFDQIVNASPSLQSYHAAYSCLQGARLRYVLMDKSFLKPDHPELIQILTQLKDLTLQKNFENEPIHLEAALDYIDIQTIDEQTDSKRLSLIQKTIDNFFSEEDVLSKEYHLKRRNSPQRERVFLAYIDLLDLEAFIAKASLAQNEKRSEDMKNYYTLAKELFEELKVTCPTSYFQNRFDILSQKLDVLGIAL